MAGDIVTSSGCYVERGDLVNLKNDEKNGWLTLFTSSFLAKASASSFFTYI